MMDNTDEESGLSEFIILKRDGAEMSIPQAQEAQSSEEGQTQETIEMPEQGDVESTTQPTQQENLQPQLPQLPQQDQSVTAPVQPETSQPGQEAVAPTLVTQPTQQELAKQVGYPDPTKPPLPTFKNAVVAAQKEIEIPKSIFEKLKISKELQQEVVERVKSQNITRQTIENDSNWERSAIYEALVEIAEDKIFISQLQENQKIQFLEEKQKHLNNI